MQERCEDEHSALAISHVHGPMEVLQSVLLLLLSSLKERTLGRASFKTHGGGSGMAVTGLGHRVFIP